MNCVAWLQQVAQVRPDVDSRLVSRPQIARPDDPDVGQSVSPRRTSLARILRQILESDDFYVHDDVLGELLRHGQRTKRISVVRRPVHYPN